MKLFAIRTAKKAGKLLLEDFRKTRSTKRATAKGLTTPSDRKSDRFIISEIKKKYPKHNILTEESGLISKKSDYTWIIDPLDGSTNFARGNPFFSVSIALMKNHEIILGVIYAPFLKDLYVVEKGKGAYLNNKRIRVSKVTSLRNSYLLSCEGGEKTNKRIGKINSYLYSVVKDLRKLGSAALEAAAVASGKVESYIVTKIYPWDVAAAILLVKEAGGEITDFKGKSWKMKPLDLVFSNKRIHERILKKLK